MPSSHKCLSLSPARARILKAGVFTVLGILGVFLGLLFFHRAVLPILAWLLPPFENFFYDIAVFGAYRTHTYVSFDLAAPNGIFVEWSNRCDDGYIFMGPNGKSVSQPGPAIFDARGELIWMSNEYDVATNIQVQRYEGEDYLTFWAGHKEGSLGQGATFMLNPQYEVAHKVHAVGEGLKADLHEFQLTKDGSALITIYNTTTMDLRPMGWGRPKNGWIEDCIFQEIDIATGRLLFQWRASDYFTAEDSYYWHPFGGYVESIPFDFYHTNSIEKDSKGNYLISSRHFHTVVCINGTSGDPIWILGGGEHTNQFTDLSDGLATGFKWQHHARWFSEEENIISLMDNGNAGPLHVDAPYSKGLLIQIDAEMYTAKVLQEYVSKGQAKSASQGSLQQLPNGNMFVGWGSAAAWSEYDADGTLLCESHFAASWTFWWERVKNYRTFKQHGWIGMPDYPPAAKMQDNILYVSWNGATEVKYWRLEGATGAGDRAFESIKVIDKHKFEQSFDIRGEKDFERFRVTALDSNLNVLRHSEPVRREVSGHSGVGIFLCICAVTVLLGAAWWLLRMRARRKDSRWFSAESWAVFGNRGYHYMDVLGVGAMSRRPHRSGQHGLNGLGNDIHDGKAEPATMPSAVEKVFAVPELLEAILLNTDWRSLYVLQRVNTTFRDTTSRSMKLKQQMHLRYKTLDKAVSDLLPKQYHKNFIIHQLGDKRELNFGPFVTSEMNTEGRFRFRVRLVSLLPENALSQPNCKRTRCKDLWLHPDIRTGSWRTMKLTSVPAPLCFDVEVWPVMRGYGETMQFEAGEGDLGALSDAIHRVYLKGIQKYYGW